MKTKSRCLKDKSGTLSSKDPASYLEYREILDNLSSNFHSTEKDSKGDYWSDLDLVEMKKVWFLSSVINIIK